MKKIIFIAAAVVIFAAFNYGIYQKEQIKANGETVFLEIVPMDPRSLLQGDYMRLRYAIERGHTAPKVKGHYLVVQLDKNKVATFKRYHEGETLAADEKLLRYRYNYHGHEYGAMDDKFEETGSIVIVPDAFMFQEGHAIAYQHAKYGIFKFDKNGNHILVGLADMNFKTIQPKDE